jgi:hypothetical protein
MNCLIGSKNVSRGNTGPVGADIEGFGEFNELGARDIRTAQEDGHLQANTRRASGFQGLPNLENVGLQGRRRLSTNELVRVLASEMPESTVEGLNKLFVINCLQVYVGRNKLLRQSAAREIHFLSSNVQMERFYH